ncbi:MAG: Aspartate carbamoyltransferase, partial [uncultured Thermomicrobiales bacterium]
ADPDRCHERPRHPPHRRGRPVRPALDRGAVRPCRAHAGVAARVGPAQGLHPRDPVLRTVDADTVELRVGDAPAGRGGHQHRERRRVLVGDQGRDGRGHDPDDRRLRRCRRDPPPGAGRGRAGGGGRGCPGPERRRRPRRAPHSGPPGPLYDHVRAGPHRRVEGRPRRRPPLRPDRPLPGPAADPDDRYGDHLCLPTGGPDGQRRPAGGRGGRRRPAERIRPLRRPARGGCRLPDPHPARALRDTGGVRGVTRGLRAEPGGVHAHEADGHGPPPAAQGRRDRDRGRRRPALGLLPPGHQWRLRPDGAARPAPRRGL